MRVCIFLCIHIHIYLQEKHDYVTQEKHHVFLTRTVVHSHHHQGPSSSIAGAIAGVTRRLFHP